MIYISSRLTYVTSILVFVPELSLTPPHLDAQRDRLVSHKKHMIPLPRTDISYLEIVVAIHDYQPTEDGCLRLKKGDIIYIQNKDNSGWWEGMCGNRKGNLLSQMSSALSWQPNTQERESCSLSLSLSLSPKACAARDYKRFYMFRM
jgi:hypothetical protein